jgi:hypothetical protein
MQWFGQANIFCMPSVNGVDVSGPTLISNRQMFVTDDVSTDQHWFLCHHPILFFTMVSFVSDTGMWLLAPGRIVKGHPNTVVSAIFYVQHYQKIASNT